MKTLKPWLYTERPKDDYHDILIEYFYKKESDEGFYRDHSTVHYDFKLVALVMKSIHFAYYDAEGLGMPSKPRIKITRSKSWKRHMKLTRPKLDERVEEEMKQKWKKKFG